MQKWTRVKLTEAGQVAEAIGWDIGIGDLASAAPRDVFLRLKSEARFEDAAFFLGQALPRLEAVAWAVRVVGELGGSGAASPDANALDAAVRWVRDPSESHRRSAWDAADQARDDSPERLAALAAFFSGGSVGPANSDPVAPPREAAGRLAATAVILCVLSMADPDAAFAEALGLGDRIAVFGPAAE